MGILLVSYLALLFLKKMLTGNYAKRVNFTLSLIVLIQPGFFTRVPQELSILYNIFTADIPQVLA